MQRSNPGGQEGGRAGTTVINPVLHEADPRDLAAASDELRDRTMSLEPPNAIAGMGIITVLMSVALAAVIVTFKFRSEIKVLLGLS